MHTLIELEDRLACDPSGQQLRELLDRLSAAATELGREQRQPQRAANYTSLERKRRACLAAMQVLTCAWERWHRP